MLFVAVAGGRGRTALVHHKARDAVVADEAGKAVWEGRPAVWDGGQGHWWRAGWGGGQGAEAGLVVRGGWIFGVKNDLE